MFVYKKSFYKNPFFLILLIFLFLNIDIQAQQFDSDNEIKKFADYLFCEKDYLRSINEYRRLSDFASNEDLQIKMGVAFLKMENYDSASAIFDHLSLRADYNNSDAIILLKMKTAFLKKNYSFVDDFNTSLQNDSIKQNITKLKYFSRLLTLNELPKNIYFDEDEFVKINHLLSKRDNLNFKSATVAALLSVLPGLGKIYTEEYGDAIYAFIFNGVFAFLAYDNFNAKHYTRAWIFSTVSLGYYGGNIYGAAASAQIYNARIKAEFDVEVDSFLLEKNYFVPKYLEWDCED